MAGTAAKLSINKRVRSIPGRNWRIVVPAVVGDGKGAAFELTVSFEVGAVVPIPTFPVFVLFMFPCPSGVVHWAGAVIALKLMIATLNKAVMTVRDSNDRKWSRSLDLRIMGAGPFLRNIA